MKQKEEKLTFSQMESSKKNFRRERAKGTKENLQNFSLRCIFQFRKVKERERGKKILLKFISLQILNLSNTNPSQRIKPHFIIIDFEPGFRLKNVCIN